VRRRSPQEKKRLSYLKDRRNDYGENSKSSRKNIRRSKRFPHRANRRRVHQILESVNGAVDEFAGEEAERRMLARRPKSWRKYRDTPLGEIVAFTLRRRAQREPGEAKRIAIRLERVRRRLRRPED